MKVTLQEMFRNLWNGKSVPQAFMELVTNPLNMPNSQHERFLAGIEIIKEMCEKDASGMLNVVRVKQVPAIPGDAIEAMVNEKVAAAIAAAMAKPVEEALPLPVEPKPFVLRDRKKGL